MTSYRFARRAFLQSIGAAFGLEILLGNLEASAEGVAPPSRLLIAHWPVGTLRARYVPEGAELSPILKPFEEAGLFDDMVALYGLSHLGVSAGGGGGHEAGTVMTMTGANVPGTRVNGGERDDVVAGGPSFDQILLRRAPALARPGPGYLNVICDARVDSHEIATQCLSYGYETREVETHSPAPTAIEHVPLMPDLAPADAYARLFGGFVPGGSAGQAALALRLRKSVLDSALRELSRLRGLAPSSEREKIDAHGEAIRKLEQQLGARIDDVDRCGMPLAPSAELRAKTGSRFDYGNPVAEPDDARLIEIGEAHSAVIRAAFQCDLIRVATFQWCPGGNHVAFQGLNPDDPERAYMHHPLSHRIVSASIANGPPPSVGERDHGVYEFLCNVHTWFNRQTAKLVRELQSTTDVFGANLLDHTIVPFVTEVAHAVHGRSPLPAVVLGGRALGLRGGQFLQVDNRPLNDLWLAVAQRYFPDREVTSALADEIFLQNPTGFSGPLAGVFEPRDA